MSTPATRQELQTNLPWVTGSIILLCVGIHLGAVGLTVVRGLHDPWGALWSLGRGGQILVELGGLSAGHVWVDGQWWRVVTTFFLHASLLHLFFNMWSLWVVGPFGEAAFGRVGTLALLGVCSVAGGLASLSVAEAPLVVGASAGVLGLASALVVAKWVGHVSVRSRLEGLGAGGLLASLAVLLVVGGFVPVIAQAGHVGGIVCGVLLGGVFARWQVNAERLGWVSATVALLIGLGLAAEAPERQSGYHEAVGARFLALQQPEAASRAFDRALELAPGDDVLQNAVAYALALEGIELDRALALVESALRADPENTDYLDTRGWVRCRQGQVEAGLRDLGEAARNAGGDIAEIEEHIRACEAARVTNAN